MELLCELHNFDRSIEMYNENIITKIIKSCTTDDLPNTNNYK